MKNALKCITGQSSSNATVVDGKLILSYPAATTPVVWQMDLTEAAASALEIQKDANDNGFALILRKSEDERSTIAAFEHREQALDALSAAAKALENAHGQLRPATGEHAGPISHTQYSQGQPRKGKILPIFLSLVVLAVLFGIWLSMQPMPTRTALTSTQSSTQANNNAATNQAGVPVSADDFLRNR